jgi:PEGA domain
VTISVVPEGVMRVAAALVGALLLSCAPAAIPTAPTVSLRMTGSPPEATVTIDDRYVGPLNVVAARGVALPVGQHQISVESPGYFPWDKIVEAKDQPVRLEVHLVPVPD